MVTVHREGGFRVAIYTDDHVPAHVHVLKDGEVIVTLVGEDGAPEIRQTTGTTRADQRKSLQIVIEQQEYLLARWQEIHGDDD
jgi:histidinol phosphatase-like PHP family hydrolase